MNLAYMPPPLTINDFYFFWSLPLSIVSHISLQWWQNYCMTMWYKLPPSVFSHINVLSNMGQLQTLPAHTIAKRIYTELFRLHNCGWNTWVTKVFALSEQYGISFNDIGTRKFKLDCKRAVKIRFESQWLADSQNVRKNPILWSYSLYKHFAHQFACLKNWKGPIHCPENSSVWPTV